MKKLLFVVSVVALLAAGCNSSQQAINQEPVQHPVAKNLTSPTTSTATATISTATTNWDIYNDPNYNFSFKHPSTVPVLNSTPGDFYIYEILIKIIQDANASDGLIVIPANKVPTPYWNGPTFSVSNLNDLAADFESLKTQNTASSYAETVTHFTTASGEPGIKVVETTNSNGTPTTSVDSIDFVGYYFYHNGNVFLFRTFNQNTLFEDIVQTFQFTK